MVQFYHPYGRKLLDHDLGEIPGVETLN